MVTPLESRRIVIAGASSLLGTDLKSLLEESRFAACDFRLVDEQSAAGQLTEAGGEPGIIQPVEEDSFNKASFIFFVGSAAFTRANLDLARRSGARIIDLSGALAGQPDTRTWMAGGDAHNTAEPSERIFAVPSAHAEIIARLALAVHALHGSSLSAVAFQPVSIAGTAGVEELESQTGQLLSFQPAGKSVFDAQVAFNMLDRFGPGSQQKLQASLQILRNEIRSCLAPEISMPAVQLLHAPVFYGATVTACARIKSAADASVIANGCTTAGFRITVDDAAPSNISAAGETALQLSPPQPDAAVAGAWWFWAAADNLRRLAANAVKLAESFLS
jgi:aspartate-semialdehyde dehydrogenase